MTIFLGLTAVAGGTEMVLLRAGTRACRRRGRIAFPLVDSWLVPAWGSGIEREDSPPTDTSFADRGRFGFLAGWTRLSARPLGPGPEETSDTGARPTRWCSMQGSKEEVMSTPLMHNTDESDDLRKLAVEQLQKKRGLQAHIVA